MRRTFIAIALTALAFIPSAQAATTNEERWFIGHLKNEICVPVDDIGSHGERVYYGTGPMHTPTDFANLMRRGGANLTLTSSQDGLVIYKSTSRNLEFVFFNDKDICQVGMVFFEDRR